MIVLICARSGSKRLPDKNLKRLEGFSLIDLSIMAGLELSPIQIYVSTDYPQLLDKKQAGVTYLERPEYLCGDDISEVEVWRYHLMDLVKLEQISLTDTVCVLPPTSPFRRTEDILTAINKLIQKDASMVMSCVRSKKTIDFNVVRRNGDGHLVPASPSFGKFKRSQDSLPFYDLTTCFYVFQADLIVSGKGLFDEAVGLVVVDEITGLDIDEYLDFRICEIFASEQIPKRSWWRFRWI